MGIDRIKGEAMSIEFGLKIVGNNKKLLIESMELVEKSIFGYIELLITPDFNLDPDLVDLLSNIRLIIHAPHENYGVDIGKKDNVEFTIRMIKKSLKWLEKLNAHNLIIHCGTADLDTARRNLSLFKEYKEVIFLENMPAVGINGEYCLGYDVESLRKLNLFDFGLCLDFGHAIKASLSLGRDYKEVISEFIKLKPKMFHISNGKFDKEIDEHLNIDDGEYDFEFIKNMINKSNQKYITLETPRIKSNSLEEDIKNLHILRNLLNF